ncbi:HDIG domain-containing protein [Bacteroidia bacterium]|nr:HDIG domain-containing protein [Bacteroidia bacterium]GHU82021.1 HDIG domain-containing protein [Bacteroidia bacterium]GHV71265.1 HDIG domain-containing protein [Bacteroidia bacterium]
MKKKLFKIPVYIYFIVVTALIIFLFPREGKFRYSFTEGRPWQYGLLTAPFDFPIYKTDAEIKSEQDTVINNFQPYFQLSEEIAAKQKERFDADFKNHSLPGNDLEYKRYLDRILKEIYEQGIVSVRDHQFLSDNRSNGCMVFRNNVAEPRLVSEIFTIKSAYSYLLENCPAYLSVDVLRMLNLNDYLHDNMKYDEATSEKVKQDMLQKISPSNGMIQAGEKIVDRGEIVDANTYNILRSLKLIYEKQAGTVYRQVGLLSGTFILIGGLMACFFFYFYYLRKNIYKNRKDIVFALFMVTLFTVLTEICITYGYFSVYIIPYTIIPIVVRTFFDSRTGQMTHLVVILICALMIPLAFEFILLQYIVCLVAIYALKDLTQRSELIKCAISIFIAYILVYAGLMLFQEGDFAKLDWNMLLYFGINFLFVMFTYPFIYIFEKVFGYISNVTLVELSDINMPVLQQLSETCPGTFQHSLQVSMLGTAAAAKVDANPQLIRTGALYHDLGKMLNPGYFVENKIEGINPHENLTLEQSARIITNHVPDGVKIAEKHNIPKAIVKFIKTHHGAGKAKFFYNSFKNKYPDAPINEEAFTYSGINPDTKETAILMMADSVEAASRSLADYTEESIHKLVDRIIDTQIADGLLNDAPLTFKNITAIKHVFVERLLSVYHSRISYPELR